MTQKSPFRLSLLAALPFGVLAGCSLQAPSVEDTAQFEQTEQALNFPVPFDKNNDLLSLQYDNSADRDDITCQGAVRMVVDKLGIKNLSVIHGAVGKQLTNWNSPYNVGVEDVANTVWGPKCNPSTQACGPISLGWIDLYDNANSAWWDRTPNTTAHTTTPHVQDVAALWLSYVNAGKRVFIAEGGMSDFTRDVLARMKIVNPSFDGSKIHLVQHSDFNHNAYGGTDGTPDTLVTTYGINYHKGFPGSTMAAGTESASGSGPGSETRAFYDASLVSSYGAKWAKVWQHNDPLGTVYPGTQANKIDFSDTNEVFYIFDLPDIPGDILQFFPLYDNGTGGGACFACTGGGTPTCTDGIKNQGETGTDCGGPCAACSTASCSDSIQNQGETGVDCGGPCAACPPPVQTNVWLEAECGATETGGYTALHTTLAGYSGSGHLQSAANQATGTQPTAVQDRATYTVTAGAAGPHKVWLRASNNNTGNDNSVFYRVNNGSWVMMNPVVAVQAGWAWGKHTADVTLVAGNNTLEIANREDGLKIDKLYVTDSSTTPTGTGSAASNCGGATCSDSIQNQGETGVDCGGPCAACSTVPTCTDGLQNQLEEGIDCGGPCAPCVTATCSDNIRNQGETGVDCGGPCAACPTCSDGVKNQSETQIDCGGPCPACSPTATCSDGMQNQGETAVDCGGPCAACPPSGSLLVADFTSGAAGFAYSDNMFRSANNAALADGVHGAGKLNVTVGGVAASAMSGGWSKTFSTVSTGAVTVSFKYSMTTADGIDPGEWVEMLVAINTTLYGVSPNDYVRRIEGGGNQGEVTHTFTTGSLPAGTHTLKLGAYMNAATASTETGTITIDDVTVTMSGAAATCSDGIQNQTETGVDCGGTCPACSPAATCSDGIKNQGELQVDCGGPCAACPTPPATCSDNIQNFDETGVDCGGSCAACPTGTNIWLEAECRVTSAGGYGTVYTAEPGYAGTGYLMSMADQLGTTPTCTDRATYAVTASVAGAHKMWFRFDNNNTNSDDSLFYRVVGQTTWQMLNDYTGKIDGWKWYQGADAPGFVVGSNMIEICNRENGLKIDKIYVTSTTTTPSGAGSAGINCP